MTALPTWTQEEVTELLGAFCDALAIEQDRVRALQRLVRRPIDDEWRRAVLAQLRAGGIASGGWGRREGESIADHTQRLLVDPVWRGATDQDIADVTGASPKNVRNARAAYTKHAKVVEVLTHAQDVHARTAFDGALTDVIHAALREYVERHGKSADELARILDERRNRALDGKSEGQPTTPGSGRGRAPVGNGDGDRSRDGRGGKRRATG